MIEIKVVSRDTAETMDFLPTDAVISIYTPGDEPAWINHPVGGTDGHRVLHLDFADIGTPKVAKRFADAGLKGIGITKIVTQDQAKAILNFVDNVLADDTKRIVVHCDAGISRSPGVAVALNQLYNDVTEVPYEWRAFNPMVCNMLLAEKGKPERHDSLQDELHPSGGVNIHRINFTEG